MKAIDIQNLTKYYGKTRGVENLNLTVEQGEFFGFIGPNGAGKSTTIRTLMGLIFPTSGSASVLGLDIVKDKTRLQSLVGYLPSEAIFYPGMKVADLLKLSADLRGVDCTAMQKQLCSRLELDTAKRVDDLSFGNRKKVGIVAALQHDPKLLILDEPTGGLDPLMQREFFDILDERCQKGTTVFLSSHILSEVRRSCSRAAVIRDGQIIACDSVDALAKTDAKRITLRTHVALPAIEGIKNVSVAGDQASFLYSGDINVLINRLSDIPLQDLTIVEPDLEEVFMHYYREEDAK